jgi:hypothetical protein
LSLEQPLLLSTFDLNVAFDSNVLRFLASRLADPVLGDQLDLFGLGSLAGTTPGLGIVNLFELSLIRQPTSMPCRREALRSRR